jgi:4-amino-4-deoxy-L-arabinose transferase-like glycosyltransferase
MFRPLQSRAAHYVLLLVVATGLCFVRLGAPSLWDVDEGHNAEAAREMFESGNWIVPTFNFQLRTDKPALLYWLQMAAYRLCGINEFAARLPSALAALMTVLLTYELGRRLFNAATGLIAGSVLASTVLFCAAAHFANPDALLLAFTTLSLLLFWDSYARGKSSWFVPAGISAGLAMLAKGPVGLVLPLTVAGVFLLWSRQLRRFWDRRLPLGILAFLAVMLPWYVWVGAETKLVFLREFFFTHNTGRFRATLEGHGGPVYYYLVCLALGFAPWSVFLGPVVWSALGRRARADGRGEEPSLPSAYRFLWCWIAVYVVFFSLSATKLPNYILPIYPPVAILTGRFLDRWRRGADLVPSWLWHAALGCLVLVGLGSALGLSLAAGLVEVPWLRGRKLPGLEAWALIGVIPVLGAVGAWWCARRQRRLGLIVSVGLAAVGFVGGLAAGSRQVDAAKAVRPLAQAIRAHQTEREIRIGCYQYYQPSLVFYCRREVYRFQEEREALEFLHYPIPVYLLVPEAVWPGLAAKAGNHCQVVGRHYDLYRGCTVVVVTNQGATPGTDQWAPRLAQRSATSCFLFVGIRFLPEIIAAQIERRLGHDSTVAVDLHLAREAHLILVADAGHHRRQLEALHHALGTEVLHSLFDQHLARAAQAHPMTIQQAVQPGIYFNARCARRLPQIVALGNLDLAFLIDKIHLGHGSRVLAGKASGESVQRRR